MQTDDGASAPSSLTKKHLFENLAILTISVGLFLAAIFGDVHGLIHGILEGGSPQASQYKMRALEAADPFHFPGVTPVPAPAEDNDLSILMSLGLAASLGLTAFAFVQYGRVRRALGSQREAERQSRRLALHDQLTGLANRRHFEEFGQRVAFERPATEHRAIFLVDLDHFKTVNDVYGHAAGDKVLVDYAARIRDHFPGGIVARFGGDEFAVITPPLKENGEALHYARFCIAGVSDTFDYGGTPLHLGASVGVAMLGSGDQAVAEALRCADIALYKAKRGGRMQIAFFEDTLERQVKERNWIESELRTALVNGNILPYFQPVVDLATREVIGYEALARWRHSERGLINPADFIPVAEECGLISQIGETILAQSCAIARYWPQQIMLSVNLSPVQLRDKGLARMVLDTLAMADFPASRLEIEITENALVSDLQTASETIRQMRGAGISVALDDFGTGHSTLNHLRVCRFDRIKIDRSFVSSLSDSHDSRKIVDAILNLSRSFGLRCTAEGIEHLGELQMLADWGCREGQGYLFGRPEQTTSFDRSEPDDMPERLIA